MTKEEAIEYVEKVLYGWNDWHSHHKKLTEAIEILLEEVKKSDNS